MMHRWINFITSCNGVVSHVEIKGRPGMRDFNLTFCGNDLNIIHNETNGERIPTELNT